LKESVRKKLAMDHTRRLIGGLIECLAKKVGLPFRMGTIFIAGEGDVFVVHHGGGSFSYRVSVELVVDVKIAGTTHRRTFYGNTVSEVYELLKSAVMEAYIDFQLENELHDCSILEFDTPIADLDVLDLIAPDSILVEDTVMDQALVEMSAALPTETVNRGAIN